MATASSLGNFLHFPIEPPPLCNCHRNFYIILKQSQKKCQHLGKLQLGFREPLPSPKTREPQSGVAEFELTTL